MSGGGGNTESSNRPWSQQLRDQMNQLYGDAYTQIGSREREFFPGATYVPASAQMESALGGMESRALQGSSLNTAAQGQVQDTLSGKYLAGGEGYNAYLDSVLADVRPNVESQFGAAGRSGSPLMAESMGKGIGRGMAPLYNQERNRMMGASSLAPQLAREDYYDLDRLAGVGERREGYSRDVLQDAMGRHDFAQNEPYGRLSAYNSILQGGPAWGQQSSSGGGKGTGQKVAGGVGTAAMLAAALACSRSFKENPQPAGPVLPKLDDLTLETWRYRPEMNMGPDRHLGPYAEEFKELFGLGDGATINVVDAFGVCLLAIKELSEKVAKLEKPDG